jgi:hypothetical protein
MDTDFDVVDRDLDVVDRNLAVLDRNVEHIIYYLKYSGA